MEFWNKLPWYLKNRYVITTMLFVVWLAFFDQHNFINQIEFKTELYRLNQDKIYYQSEIIEIEEDLQELLSDNRKLEKFARERYYMKKDNEEIFVFVSEDKD
jgi:cell division protein FtsB